MDLNNIIKESISFVQETLAGAEGGHDWFHIERVWRTACFIHEKEGSGDLLTIELAALLHDISDAKFNGGDDEMGSRMALAISGKKGSWTRNGEAYSVHYQTCFLQGRVPPGSDQHH